MTLLEMTTPSFPLEKCSAFWSREKITLLEHHPLASFPRAAAKGMTGIDDRIVNDLEIHRLPLMIGARET